MDIPVTGPAQIPATVEVICGTLRGTYDVAKTKILYLSHMGGIREATPTEFERLGGRQATKKWKQSIRVVDSHGQPGKSLGEWLAGTAGTSGEGQRQAFAWLTMGQRGGAWADGGDVARGSQQSKSNQLREQFQLQLLDFLQGRIDNPGPGPGSQAAGGEFGPVTLGTHTFDLRKIYNVVQDMGGYSATQAMPDGWQKVANSLGLEARTTNTLHACRSVYEHYLLRAERLDKAREAAGIPPPPRRQPSSPTGSGPGFPTAAAGGGGGGGGGGPFPKQEQAERLPFAERQPPVAQRAAPPPAAAAQYSGRRPAPPPPPQWGHAPNARGGGGMPDRRAAVDDARHPAGGVVNPGKGGTFAGGMPARNGGGGAYDAGYHDDVGPAYEGVSRGGYDGPNRGGYDGPSRTGYGPVRRNSFEGPSRGGGSGYDSGVRGGYDSGRRGLEGGVRGGAYGGGRGAYDDDDRGGYSGRGGNDGGGRNYEGGGGRGLYDAPPGPAPAGGRYTSLERLQALQGRYAGLEALLAAQQPALYDSQLEQRSSLLPLDIDGDQLLLAAGLGLQGAGARDAGGPMANPLVLDSATVAAPVGRPAAIRVGNSSLLQLSLAGGGGGASGRQAPETRDALLVTLAGGPGSSGLGGRGGTLALEQANLVSLAGGPASVSSHLLPIHLGRGGGGGGVAALGGGGGGGGQEPLQSNWSGRGRGSAQTTHALQLQGSRAAALLGLQNELGGRAVVDDPVISNLLSEYFGGGGGLPVGLVRTGSGNIGVGLGGGGGGGGGGYKRGPPDGGAGGGGDNGSGGGKRPAL